MKKVAFLLGLTICILASVSAQEETFKPSGKVFMNIFSNFNTTITNEKSASAFALERAYFGYDYKINKNFSSKVTFDIGDPGKTSSLHMTAYIKNAYVNYQKEKLSVYFGLIGTTSFKVQEGIWGNRYIEKSFQDAYKFNASADLGISASYDVTDWLSADMMFVNGEGYKNLQSDSTFKTGIGITGTVAKVLTLRAYYDFMGTSNTQSTTSFFAGYKIKSIAAGVEYNMQQNVGNTEGKNISGTSVFANYAATKSMKIIARYDMLASNTVTGQTANWNLAKDGSLILAGLEFQPTKGVKFTPNYRLWTPADATAKNKSSFFLNCEIKF